MEIKTFYVPGISHFSYAVLGQKGIIIIDPKRIIRDYLTLQKETSLPITHILLTHTHADFISGHVLLKEATGAEIIFPHETNEGQSLDLGDVFLEVMKTPGHTPDHVSYLLYEKSSGEKIPFAVFTGDSLFAGDVGRPDLFGEERREELTGYLFETMGKYQKLPDHVLVYPAHGAGSFCGKRLSQRCPSSIGYEKFHNWALKCSDYDEFKKKLLEGMPLPPPYYFTTSRRNHQEEGLESPLEPLREISLSSLKEYLVIDLRDQACFAAFHLPGSLNIAADIHFATGAGFVLDPEDPFILVGDPEKLSYAYETLFMMGFDRVAGTVSNAIEKWRVAASPHGSLKLLSPQTAYELYNAGEAIIIDVRTESEFEESHISGALHLPLVSLKDQLHSLPEDKLLIFQCGHGCRGSLAASLALRAGFENVANMAGGIMAWKASNLPLAKD